MPRSLEIKIYRNRRGSEVPCPRDGDYPVFNGQPVAFADIMQAHTINAAATLMRLSADIDPLNPAYLPLASNIMRLCRVAVVATQTGGGAGTVGDSLYSYFAIGIKRLVLPGTTVLVGVAVPIAVQADAGAAAWTIVPAADAVNGGLAITVTGAVNKIIDWTARIQVLDLPIA